MLEKQTLHPTQTGSQMPSVVGCHLESTQESQHGSYAKARQVHPLLWEGIQTSLGKRLGLDTALEPW